MGSDEASKKLVASLIKANIYAAILSAATASLTGIFTGLIIFPSYLYVIVFIPYLLGLSSLSEKEIASRIKSSIGI
ncbi:hypothetical protein ACK3SF_00825 [Candidatus Nanosalina sp. VS9-1]|uniref:hypothetical protein n=1 Tax=Candidatus Nanosalina sp. VS9-1 TaxID=3388566 RepID=UPI0039DF6A5B